MGLDMYLYKRSKELRQKILKNLSEEFTDKEIAYWRKDWLIHEWFCSNFNVENCKEVIINQEDILNLK